MHRPCEKSDVAPTADRISYMRRLDVTVYCLKSERLIGASIVARNASRLYFYGEASGLDLETGVLAHGTFSMNCLGKDQGSDNKETHSDCPF